MHQEIKVDLDPDLRVAYLCLGSNLGDRAANLLRAVTSIACGTQGELHLSEASSIYETEPVDNLHQPGFLNMVISISGKTLEPFSLLGRCLEIESLMGRQRRVRRGARTVDIDLLLLDDLVVNGNRAGIDLQLPHPRMHLRRFVLTPMAEIAPHVKHPVSAKTMTQLLETLDDPSAVRIYRE